MSEISISFYIFNNFNLLVWILHSDIKLEVDFSLQASDQMI